MKKKIFFGVSGMGGSGDVESSVQEYFRKQTKKNLSVDQNHNLHFAR